MKKTLLISLALAGCHITPKPHRVTYVPGQPQFWQEVGGIDAIGNQYPLFVNDAGQISAAISGSSGNFTVGANGTQLTNIGVGSCTLASGQCNAVVSGTQGTSLCVASVQGTSQTLVGCDARADAGSATAFCQATASGTAAIVCFN